jgi:hypothetical protein
MHAILHVCESLVKPVGDVMLLPPWRVWPVSDSVMVVYWGEISRRGDAGTFAQFELGSNEPTALESGLARRDTYYLSNSKRYFAIVGHTRRFRDPDAWSLSMWAPRT